jgi:hypothetical protein
MPMNKHITQTTLRFLLLIIIAISSGCGPLTAVPPPTLTPAPSQTPTKAAKPSSTAPFLSTVTPASTRYVATPTLSQVSATPEYYSILTQIPNSECLPPLTNFAYPVGMINNLGNITPHPRTLPSNQWRTQISLPVTASQFDEGDIKSVGDELFILNHSNDYSETSSIIVYNTHNNQLHTLQGGKDNTFFPEKLLDTKDGSLWLLGTDDDSKTLSISKYNNTQEVFELIKNQDNVGDYPYILDVKEDERGQIWILLRSTGLYRFDPKTQKLDFFLSMADNLAFGHIAPVKDGSVWILAGGNSKSFRQDKLLRYFPETGDVQEYKGTPTTAFVSEDFANLNVMYRSPLFLDKDNRLWVGNYGWLNNPDSEYPSWYRVIQSPVFIDGSASLVVGFFIAEPSGMTESSNGMFWFWTYAGTVRLNPQNGEWCMFTTYSSPVVEDKSHNLWMIADSKLYKYQLDK